MLKLRFRNKFPMIKQDMSPSLFRLNNWTWVMFRQHCSLQCDQKGLELRTWSGSGPKFQKWSGIRHFEDFEWTKKLLTPLNHSDFQKLECFLE